MAKPEADVRDLARLIAGTVQRIQRIERREAYTDKRTVIANAGGLFSPPVPLVAPDASGWYSVTTAGYTQMAALVGGSYGSFWLLAAGNGNGADLSLQVIYPSKANRVLGTSVNSETHPTLGPIHRVTCALDADLAAATTASGNTVILQAKTANSSVTNKFRILSCGWGSPNV